MALSPEVLMGAILAILFGAVLVGLAALSRVPAKRGVILLGALLVMAGAAVALGVVQIPSGDTPKAQGLFEAQFLISSDTDRTETGEIIAADGHTITYTMNDANMDGLGDVNLDVRVTNKNVGAVTDTWLFSGELTFVDFTQVSNSGAKQPIVNRTDFNTRYAVSYSGTDAGAPNFNQEAEKVYSRDFTTGASDVLNVDFEMSPSATDDLAAGGVLRLTTVLGGITMNCVLTEGV